MAKELFFSFALAGLSARALHLPLQGELVNHNAIN